MGGNQYLFNFVSTLTTEQKIPFIITRAQIGCHTINLYSCDRSELLKSNENSCGEIGE